MSPEQAAAVLDDCRSRIDELDRRITALLNDRARLVEIIGNVKLEQGMRIYEPKREDQVFANVARNNHGPLDSEALRRVYERILDEMRTLQRKQSAQANSEEEEH